MYFDISGYTCILKIRSFASDRDRDPKLRFSPLGAYRRDVKSRRFTSRAGRDRIVDFPGFPAGAGTVGRQLTQSLHCYGDYDTWKYQRAHGNPLVTRIIHRERNASALANAMTIGLGLASSSVDSYPFRG